MKANPGGQIDLREVVGRDRLIQTLWDALDQQSVVMTAERRIGKTTVIKKMTQEHSVGWMPVYQDLERYHSADEFAMSVYESVHHFLGRKQRTMRRAKEWFRAMEGMEIGGIFKLPEGSAGQWKDILTRSIEDLVHENDASDSRLLFFWDEMPLMLANIRDQQGEHVAMQVLDVLRALRQTHAPLRMVITGSIGLHHVLASLKEKNYGNSPLNDMLEIEVQPLEEADAIQLARKLLEGEALGSDQTNATAGMVATEADCFPFYIHHVVKALKLRGLPATPDSVRKVVAAQLADDNDPWELLHYRDRIHTYYGPDESVVLAILDMLAADGDTASVNDILAMLKGSSTFDNREQLLKLLSLMVRDHYLQRWDDGRYRFRFPLLRRWWKLSRGL